MSPPELPVKCLLVDDVPENLLALAALLRQDGIEPIEASSGAEALELLLVHDIALALIDVQMPEMDGFELAELMRGSARTRQVPIIFVTAGARDQQRLFRGYESGAVDFLFKPIDPRILRNKANVFFLLHRQNRQLAQELRDRTETLRFNEMFTAVLGHDLRNPLSTITLSADLVQRLSDNPKLHQVAARMRSSSERMSRLIDTLLDLSRARLGGGIPLTRRPIDLVNVIEHTIQEFTAAHPDRIQLQVHGDLGGEWDGDRIAQAASNLIGNALQHGQDVAPILVQIDGTQVDLVCISVSNRGHIDAAELPYLFNPFRSGDPRTRTSKGLGLGLYIVEQIAQAHNGQIDVVSDEPSMVVFKLQLPRKSPP